MVKRLYTTPSKPKRFLNIIKGSPKTDNYSFEGRISSTGEWPCTCSTGMIYVMFEIDVGLIVYAELQTIALYVAALPATHHVTRM
jgi:hypothetical protein